MIYFLVLITWLVAVNITAYFLMRKDKIRAVRHGWRIPENTFFLFCLSGGFAGVYCGMQRFHHKTKHFAFKLAVMLSGLFWSALLLCGFFYFRY